MQSNSLPNQHPLIQEIKTDPEKHKDSKLNIFLASLSHQCLSMIQSYLHAHQKPETHEEKLDKIKLYHDLFIICQFKKNEQFILNRKKSVKQVCRNIHDSLNKLSEITIKERIQKKLANISVKDIMEHISGNIDFSFNSKRKLINCNNSLKSFKRERTPQKSEFDFSESVSSANHKITQFFKRDSSAPRKLKENKKIEENHSKTTKSTRQFRGKSFKTVIAKISRQEETGSEQQSQKQSQQVEPIDNDFLNLSEHDSDQEQLIKPQPTHAQDLQENNHRMTIFSQKSKSKFEKYKQKNVEIYSIFQDLRSQSDDPNLIIEKKSQAEQEDKPTQIKKEKRISSCKKAMKKIQEEVQTLQSLFPKPIIETQDIPYIQKPIKTSNSSENSQFFQKIFKRQSFPKQTSKDPNEDSQKQNMKIDQITQKQLQFVFDLNNPQNKNNLSQNTLPFESQNRSSQNSTVNTQDNIDRIVNLYHIQEQRDKTQFVKTEESKETEEYSLQLSPIDEYKRQKWNEKQLKQLKKAIIQSNFRKLQSLKKKKSLEGIILQGNSLGCEIEQKLLVKLEEEE